MLKLVVSALLVVSVLGLSPLYQHKETFQQGSDTSYIVVLHNHAPANVSLGVEASKIQHTYDMGESFRGFAVWLSGSELKDVLSNGDVAYVEEDTTFRIDPISEGNATEMDVDWLSRPDWGQVRLEQKGWALNTSPANLYTSGATATYASPTSTTWDWNGVPYGHINTAPSVTVYVLDTGVLISHQEFGGRALPVQDFVTPKAADGDCNGHGTHCAGSIGGKNRGVATQVTIQGVRVLNCQGSGTTANIVAGINWIVSQNRGLKGNIMSASLGGSYSQSLNDATDSAAANGIIPIIAAGNSNQDVKDFSPASAPGAIAVCATASNDYIASFSNWGTRIAVCSPGSSIHSAYIGSSSTYSSLSGTSMATPLVAGAVAMLSQSKGGPHATNGLTKAQALSAINTYSTRAVKGLTGTKAGTPDLLIYDLWK